MFFAINNITVQKLREGQKTVKICQIVNGSIRSWLFVVLMVITVCQNFKIFIKKSLTVLKIGFTALTKFQKKFHHINRKEGMKTTFKNIKIRNFFFASFMQF